MDEFSFNFFFKISNFIFTLIFQFFENCCLEKLLEKYWSFKTLIEDLVVNGFSFSNF